MERQRSISVTKNVRDKIENRITLKDNLQAYMSPILRNTLIFQKTQENTSFSHYKEYKKASELIPKYKLLKFEYERLNGLKLIYEMIYALRKTRRKIKTLYGALIKLLDVALVFDKDDAKSNLLTAHVNKFSDNLLLNFKEFTEKFSEIKGKIEALKKHFSQIHLPFFLLNFLGKGFLFEFLSHLSDMKVDGYTIIEKLLKLRVEIFKINYCTDMSFTTNVAYQIDQFFENIDYIKKRLIFFKSEYINSQFITYNEEIEAFSKSKMLNYTPDNRIAITINNYMETLIRHRSHHLTKELLRISIEVFSHVILENEDENSENNRGIPSSNGKSTSLSLTNLKTKHNLNYCKQCINQISLKSKQVTNCMRKEYIKFVEDENLRATAFLLEIMDFSKDLARRNSKLLFQKSRVFRNHASSTKTLYWSNNLKPTEMEYLKGLYQDILWRNIKKLIYPSFVSVLLKGQTECLSRLNNIVLATVERDYIWKSKVKIEAGQKAPPCVTDTLSELVIAITFFHNMQQWDSGICTSMSLVLKDKFRYREEQGIPSSVTMHYCLRNQIYLQDQLKVLHRKGIVVDDIKTFLSSNFYSNLFISFHTFTWFLNITLRSKRQMYLSSASWEQFFVVTSVDIKIILCYFGHLLSNLKEILPDVNDNPKSSMLMEQYERMKAFEEVSFKMLVRSISVKSKEILQQHMPLGKIWRRRGVSVSAYQANTYISVATQSLFAPILECFNCISRSAGIELICRCVTVYIKNWMDYILEEQILFSYFGCQQLLLDFQHLLQWFENDSFSLTLDELNEIQSLDVIRQMRSAIIILSCQSDGRKKSRGRDGSFGSDLSGSGFIGSAQSAVSQISQVSIESVADDQFDEVIEKVDLHDKERWLDLRVKRGITKRNFLCIG